MTGRFAALWIVTLVLSVAQASSLWAQSSFGAGNGLATPTSAGAGCSTSGTSLLKGNGGGGCGNAASGTDYAPATAGTSLLKGNGVGAFASAVSGTDYAPATSGAALLKGNSSGGFANAVSGTDYAPATSGFSLLKGNGSGGFAAAVAGTDYQAPIGGNTLATSVFATAINSSGVISGRQPAFTDMSGTATAAQVPYSGGMQFGATQLASTGTAPTSGQCLGYNGTGITGEACSGALGQITLCNNVSGTSGGSFTCKQSTVGINIETTCYLNAYYNTTGTAQSCSLTANGGSAFTSSGYLTANSSPIGATLTGLNTINFPINMTPMGPFTGIIQAGGQ